VNPSAFVRLGNASKVSDRLKSRCLSELQSGPGQFGQDEKRTFAVLRTEQDVLQKRIQGCLNEIVQSKWGKLIEEFLDENEPVLLEDLKMESEEGGWQSTLPENYLWKGGLMVRILVRCRGGLAFGPCPNPSAMI
jgi:hypothetical protein